MKKLAFGLRNAPSTFSKFINEVTCNLQGTFSYLDDILVHSKTEEENYTRVRALFERFREYGVVINPSKCSFCQTETNYLGHRISPEGISPLPGKVDAIKKYPRPSTGKQLRSFLGLINFYNRFLKNGAELTASLHKLHSSSRGNKKLKWTEETITAFEKIKEILAENSLLVYPDHNAPLSLVSDASNIAIAAVLQQFNGETWQPIAFFSRPLSDTQKRYSTFGKELLATSEAVKHFKPLISCRKFHILTDNNSLKRALQNPKPRYSDREMRQLSIITEFTSDIRHVPGALNTVADPLSRVTINSITDLTNPVPVTEIAELQKTDPEIQALKEKNTTSMTLAEVKIPNSNETVLCEVFPSKRPRPIIPKSVRKRIFQSIHGFSHPGQRASRKMILNRYVWPGAAKDISTWVKECQPCQCANIQRHTKPELRNIPVPAERFSEIHVDLVGKLPECNRYSYLLTIADRYSRWIEALPLTDCLTDTVMSNFILHWIARFGVPEKLYSDNGSQFTSHEWGKLMKLLGIEHVFSSPYHPQTQGLLERAHKTIKTSLRAHDQPYNWLANLGFTMLGLRICVKEDLDCSAAELVYGANLRLPYEFISPTEEPSSITPYSFSNKLKTFFRERSPIQTRNQPERTIYIPSDLDSCTHVFLLSTKRPTSLHPNYTGPYRVIFKGPSSFLIDYKGQKKFFSKCSLKPAYLSSEEKAQEETTPKQHQSSSNTCPSVSVPTTETTRSGRRVTLPRYLQRDYLIERNG